MNNTLRQKVVVQPGGIIELHCPELEPGAVAEVIIMDSVVRDARPLTSLIGAARGGFASVAEVDAFIRKERDAWNS